MQPEHYWLHQQGEAFGSPGLEPRWTSSVKDAVCTAIRALPQIPYADLRADCERKT